MIDGGRPVELSPDFLLADVERLSAELAEAAAAGLRSAIDAMPADCGRNPGKLAELSRRTGVQLVAATGLHHERFYGPSHWSLRASEDELADLFVADVVEGIDERDYGGPIIRRTSIRAGIVKVAGSDGGPSARDMPIFRAAAAAHRRTGVPFIPTARAARAPWSRSGFLSTRACPLTASRSATSTRSSIASITASCSSTGAFVGLRPGIPMGRS